MTHTPSILLSRSRIMPIKRSIPLMLAVLVALPLLGQQATVPTGFGLPDDWSHHRLIFSEPGTYADAVASGRAAQWYSTVNDSRYLIQRMKRNPALRGTAEPQLSATAKPEDKTPKTFKKDWSKTLGAGLVNPNTYPAKFSFSITTASCSSDYTVFPTGTAGGSSQATIVAYNELYSACTGSPTVYWQYNTAYAQASSTADGSKIATSPVLSPDGSQVAFIQVNSSSHAILVILKWASSTTLVQMTSAHNVSNANYRTCSTPCMTTIPLNGTPNDTWSAPYYDYASDDSLYVGDNSGKLHKFTGVFVGSPAEVTASWPATLSGILASPVYDPTSGYVFVGNTSGVLYAVGSGNAGTTTGSVHGTSSTLAGSDGVGIYDAPLVDSSAEKVYVFVGTTAVQSSGCTTANDNCVYQFTATFTSGVGSSEDLGTGASTAATDAYLFDGTFDNIYFSSTNGTAGNLYVVGSTGGGGGELYQVPISGTGAMGAPVNAILSGNTVSDPGSPAFPGPVTEFCNNSASACVSSGTATTSGTDYIFVSVYDGFEAGCTDGTTDGCVLAFNVNTPATRSETVELGQFEGARFTSAPGNFSSADIGRFVSDGGNKISANTYITAYTSGSPNDTIDINQGTSCFLCGSETITVSGVVSNASNLNETAQSSGCWITGGFIIDNSVPTGTEAGASQIYFMTLDSSVTNLCGHAGSGSISGVQAAQSAP
jgi:hypothetical protein